MNYFQPPNFKEHQLAGLFTEKIPKEKISIFKKKIFFPEQIHSSRVISITKAESPNFFKGDAVICEREDLAIGVQTADCLPILIGDLKRRLVCVIHAGWRGTVKGILIEALDELLNRGVNPKDLVVAIGPHIQGSCYEVGQDLIDSLPTHLKKSPFLIQKGSKFFLNLALINLTILSQFKVPNTNIWVSQECTHCLPQKYHSYRREKNYLYTQIAIISLNNNIFQMLNELHL